MKKWLPWTCLVVFALWFLSGARAPEPKNKFDLTLFGRLPVLLNGRIQPMDTVARNALLSMRGKSTVRAVGNTLSATEWMLEAMTKPELADQRKVFRVQAPELEGLLGADKPGLNYYAYNDFTNQLPQLQSQIQTLAKSEESRDDAAKNRTAYQKDLMHLYSSLMLYRQIKNSLQPEGCVDFPADIAAYKAALGPAMTAVRKQDVKEEFDKSAMERLSPLFHEFQDMASVAYPLAVPPKAGDAPGNWRNIGASLIESARTEEIHPAIPFLAAIASSYAKNRPQDFRAAVAGYEVAGKTGTAQVPKPGGGYYDDRHVGSFVGFAPATDPKFMMIVRLDNPKNVDWAESSAAPTFGEIASWLLNYWGVPKTR